ncbi:hypothetical protein GA0111570_11264 [Raineyella antarctica]|uniref:Uncharacterized protein n=1 Tax=Raineyella antarctica TaxID=1577474 RepID=A0A1G6HSA0_9ACTN|nr:hypothetical protein [Raineyella antarctica]SDB97018.1 hypothetical protein GA0111570_11264 [Raineyella antarctica]
MSTISTALSTLLLLVVGPRTRDERGLSQSTENAILLAGAVTVATIVITAVTAYVKSNMPS